MSSHQRKILVCSTDDSFLALFQNKRLAEKYSLIRIADIADLVAKIYDEMPHLIVADVHASDVAAFDMCGQVKTDIILGHIPLMVVTDSAKAGSKIDCGADLYLSKPVEFEELRYHADRIVSQTIDELDINPLKHMAGNRSTVQKMEACLDGNRSYAVCCLDLKNLHVYNEAYGVHRGDFLIREISNIVREVVGDPAAPDTFVGHLGGDDFILLTLPESACEVAEKIIEAFDRSIDKFYEPLDRERGYMVLKGVDGKFQHHSFVSLSIAIITNELIRYERVSDITKTAAQIQHYLKRFPASTYLKDRRSDNRQPVSIQDLAPASARRYHAEEAKREKQISKHSEILAAVTHFLKPEDIATFCQPIVNVRTHTIHGYEALSRFKKQDGAYMDPAQIFHAAREANMIREFDVLCAKKALINNEGLPRDKKLFINLNRETLISRELLNEIFQGSLVPLDQIVIELTEQSLLGEIDQILSCVDTMRSQGIQFAVDDMGGGQVSLRETAALKPDFIKFDGSLIRNIDTNETKQKIFFSLLVFAKGIGAKSVAEGIETQGEKEYLERSGIDFGQGYFLGRPAKVHFVRV